MIHTDLASRPIGGDALATGDAVPQSTDTLPQASTRSRISQAYSRAMHNLKDWAKSLKRDVNALSIAIRKPECPLSAKLVAGATIAYALSPIDLIPDCIPILGMLDDLIIVPLGITAAIRLLPPGLMDQCRKEAEEMGKQKKNNWKAAVVIGLVWAGTMVVTAKIAIGVFSACIP